MPGKAYFKIEVTKVAEEQKGVESSSDADDPLKCYQGTLLSDGVRAHC